MTERPSLTDEQLRVLTKCHTPSYVGAMATELIALRAERAKPTPPQSDEETARKIVYIADHTMRDDAIVSVKGILASIRAEGSAERAKLEWMRVRIEGLETVARGVDAMGVEIRALRALLTEVPRWLMNLTPRPLRRRIDEAVAQPAESGATEGTDEVCSGGRDTGLEFAFDLIESATVENLADEVRAKNRAMREDVLRSDVCDAVRIIRAGAKP